MPKKSLSQERAIIHGKGPMLVLAGPGSGKTFVITNRIKYLIEEHGVEPDEILVITFSKAAALEMKERFLSLCEDNFYPVHFGTFHAIFYHILKNTFHYQSNNIITENMKRDFLRQIIQEPKYHNTVQDTNEMVELLLCEISAYKNQGNSFISTIIDNEIFKSIYREYNQLMKSHRKLDFDDMVLHCYYLLSKNQDVLEEWQRRYQYILIDEYQDINNMQYVIVKMLIGENQNLFVVGDDDQAIYKFRGSNPKIMLNFKQDFPDAKEVLLETNYRSCGNIVSTAVSVIEENRVRFPKKIQANREQGKPVTMKGFETMEEEYGYLLNRIKALYQLEKISYNQMSCIFRTNQNASYLIERFTEAKIPYVVKEKPQNIYNHFIAKDLLSYLKFAKEEKKRTYFYGIMNKPKRYISRNAVQNDIVNFEELLSYYRDKTYMKESIKKFQYDLAKLEKMDLFASINYIRKGMGYDDYIRQIAIEKNMKWDELVEIINDFQRRMKMHTSIEALLTHIETYEKKLKDIANKSSNYDGVQVITMHASKGLEFPVVFLPDCNEGVVPHKKSATKEDIEEERRMFYVGMTRAKDLLEILFVKGTKKEPVIPSRFLPKKQK